MIRSHIVLLAAIAVSAVSQSSIFAVLPPLAREIGLTDIQIGSIASIAAFCFVLSAPFLGGLSERRGRVPFIAIGLGVAVVTNLVYAATILAGLAGTLGAATVFALLLGVRILLNVSWGGMFPAAFAFVADATAGRGRAAGAALIGAAFGTGAILGPAIAWALTPLGAVAPFIGIALLSFGVLVAVLRSLVDIRPPAGGGPDALAGDGGLAGAVARLWPFLGIGLAGAMATVMIQQLTAFRLQDQLGLDTGAATRQAGIALTVLAVTTLAAQSLVVWGGERWTPAMLMAVGSAVAAAGSLGFALAGLPTVPGHWILPLQAAMLAVLGLGVGLILPSNAAAVMQATGDGAQGRAAGLLNAALGAGTMAGPVLGTMLYRLGTVLPFILATVLFAFAFALAFGRRMKMRA